jgi:glycosyltransferase involved in cell wall biosynthesis
MTSRPLVSVIVCTCNRAGSLRQTLGALGKVKIPAGWEAELIVVDNGSTDGTSLLLGQAQLPNMRVTGLCEPRAGKSNALNAGLERAAGEILLFTDDDVIPSEDWIEKMVALLSEPGCDAVVGRIELADNLRRPWLGTRYQALLGVLDFGSGPLELVGANAGIRSSVLQKVSRYDPELGPGALGLGEDTLFSHQLEKAGFRLKHAEDVRVIHHPGESRLLRRAWLGAARNVGRTNAYLRYHWEHDDIKTPYARFLLLAVKLWFRRMLQPPPSPDSEGCPEWELSYVWQLEMYRQFCLERRRPRNYEKHGLNKRVRGN